jgi:putative transposase
MNDQLPTRKKIRLARPTYDGWLAFSITICTNNRLRSFSSAPNVNECLQALHEASEKHGMRMLAYCYMPDHAHLLLEGHDNTNLIDFVKLFKQLSGYRFKQRTSRPLWQKGYYDRIVRLEEDLEDYAQYIYANPVRAGFVSDARLYAFSGGSYFELMLGGRPEGHPYGRIAR